MSAIASFWFHDGDRRVVPVLLFSVGSVGEIFNGFFTRFRSCLAMFLGFFAKHVQVCRFEEGFPVHLVIENSCANTQRNLDGSISIDTG